MCEDVNQWHTLQDKTEDRSLAAEGDIEVGIRVITAWR